MGSSLLGAQLCGASMGGLPFGVPMGAPVAGGALWSSFGVPAGYTQAFITNSGVNGVVWTACSASSIDQLAVEASHLDTADLAFVAATEGTEAFLAMQSATPEQMQRIATATQMQLDAVAQLQFLQEELDQIKLRADRAANSPPRRVRKEREGPDGEGDLADVDDASTAEAIRQCKLIQRSSNGGDRAWHAYCQRKGNKTFDPKLHHKGFLQGFVDDVLAGEFGDLQGINALKAGYNGCAAFAEGKLSSKGKGKSGPPEKPPDDADPRAIFVAGLPRGATEDALKEHFGSFGLVADVHLKFDQGGDFRGCGCVEFAEEEPVLKVLRNYDFNIFRGKWINCLSARRQKSRKSRSDSTLPLAFVKRPGARRPDAEPDVKRARR